MTHVDLIPSIEQLGYTPREAAFIYLVARNSGYFLARQFNWFLRRKGGALTQGFVDKLRAREHAAVVAYDRNRFVFHVKSKTIYRLLDIQDSQNRRIKGDHEIRMRLMILDYMLDRLDQRFLSTEHEKIDYFSALPGIATGDLPRVSFQPRSGTGETTDRYFVERFPIGVTDQRVQFAYFDEGAFTVKSFIAFLDRHRNLLAKLGAFELSYVALNGNNFASAQREFFRIFPPTNEPNGEHLLPRGIDHLTAFLRAQKLWDQNSKEFQHQDLIILREGETLYTAKEHDELKRASDEGQSSLEQKLHQIIGADKHGAMFSTCLLQQNYPVFTSKNRGSWLPKSDSVLASMPGSI